MHEIKHGYFGLNVFFIATEIIYLHQSTLLFFHIKNPNLGDKTNNKTVLLYFSGNCITGF